MAKDPTSRRIWKVALMLYGSGACALVYQVAWFRAFRMIFGASTMATAAVLALFAGGLGAGGLVLGRRADQHPNPTRLYAMLEIGVALSAAATPLLLWLARSAYIAVGGTPTLGLIGGTIARLLLATLVLGIPTFFMGGTLPSAARAVEGDDDKGRRRLGWLYGVNTLGAVTGCVAANFWLLEQVGTRNTLLVTAAVNVAVSLAAFWVAREAPSESPVPAEPQGIAEPPKDAGDRTVRLFVIFAAAVVGLAFFIMEIVWYRMLGPLLGGSVYTFGLILAVALLGIGLGGALYGLLREDQEPTLEAFGMTAVLEALCMAVPYALGDNIAKFALVLRSHKMLGFSGLTVGWVLLALLVVLPAAALAGYQFPMLIGLLGRGRRGVGRETGLAYAANTAGAIVGSILGGFVLLPVLGGLGCWRAVAWLLTGLGIAGAALAMNRREERRMIPLVVPGAVTLLVAILLNETGPTALWRHSPIGAGRIPTEVTASPNAWQDWRNAERRNIHWEADGVESSVALSKRMGFSFIVNGKADGHIRYDAPTQVMSGLIGAILHPRPARALVIGLGTGSTAGWLGAIPEMTQVDVVELEPAIVRVARDCVSVNHNALANPKVHVTVGDAREVLLTTRAKYDLIFSEPSNPFRAGIASLFTYEYYQAVAARLEKGGLFLQWVMAYDVDSESVRTVYATLASAFEFVETWELASKDLLLIASKEPLALDAEKLRAKIAQEPYRAALANAWRAIDLEGMLGHYRAGPKMARAILEQESSLNTDDKTVVEFGFARAASRAGGFDPTEILATAKARGEGRPTIAGDVDWALVEDRRIAFRTSELVQDQLLDGLDAQQLARATAQSHYLGGKWQEGLAAWRSQSREPNDPTELAIVGEMLAEQGDEAALPYIAKLRASHPIEADVIQARFVHRQGRFGEAMVLLETAFERYRVDPWPWPTIMQHSIAFALDLGRFSPGLADRVYAALKQPFVGYLQEEMRIGAMLVAAGRLPLETTCVDALSSLEPLPPWRLSVLSWRSRCYEATKHRLGVRAAVELDEFLQGEARPFGLGLTEVELR